MPMNPVMTAYCVVWEVLELGWVKPLTNESQGSKDASVATDLDD